METISIYVISLERVPERMNNIRTQLRGLKYHVFHAVDGRNLTENEMRLRDSIIETNGNNRPLKLGEIGCLLSHYTLWKQISVEHAPYTMIFEDDLRIVGAFRAIIPQIMKLHDFDILYLGYRETTNETTIVHKIQSYEIRRSVRPLQTHAYILSRSAAKTLASFLVTEKTGLPVDCFLNTVYELGLIRCVCVFPQIVEQGGFTTTVWLKE